MLIERQLENDIINIFKSMPELSASQVVGSREVAAEGETKTEDDTNATIVAVACGFRQNDAFSLTPITMSISITILTRVELDPTSAGHNNVVDAIVELISQWHKDGNIMTEALSSEKFFAGELRMDGGTARVYDQTNQTWSETINIAIRGAEKFVAPPPPPEQHTTKVKYRESAGRPDWEGDIVGTFKNNSVPYLYQADEVLMGDHVTYIADSAFANCSGITVVSVPSSVTGLGYRCLSPIENRLNEITFLGRTLAEVQSLSYYPWGITDLTKIHAELG